MNPTGTSSPNGVLENVDIRIEGERIESIERAKAGESETESAHHEIIDCSGLIAVPGFVNAHHHLYQSFLRGIMPDADLYGWFAGRRSHLKAYTPDVRYHATRLALVEMLDAGVTTVCEFGSNAISLEHSLASLRALDPFPVRVIFGSEYSADAPDDSLVLAEKLSSFPSSSFRVVPATVPPSFDDSEGVAQFGKAVRFARQHGFSMMTHVLERSAERKSRPFSVLSRTGALGADMLLAHVVHPTDAEIEVMAQTGTAVSYNPLSNMRLGSGIMPLGKMVQAGVRVGVGTDGSCNDSGNIFETLKIGMGLQRAHHRSPSACTVSDTLRMATIGGAEALGIERVTGSLESAKYADIVLIDPKTSNFGIVNDPAAQVILNATPRNVKHVIAAGSFVKRDWKILTLDETAIVQDALRCAEGFFRRLGKTGGAVE